MNATATQLFTFNKNYKDTEQVRIYFADFMSIKNSLGRFSYNSDFNGKIPGLIGSPNEDTGIYLLQTLASQDEIRAKIEAFIDAGGYRLSTYPSVRMPKGTERGTLVCFGWYSSGTGWSELENVIIKLNDQNAITFKFPRQRNWRTHNYGPSSYLFKPNTGAAS